MTSDAGPATTSEPVKFTAEPGQWHVYADTGRGRRQYVGMISEWANADRGDFHPLTGSGIPARDFATFDEALEYVRTHAEVLP